MREQAIEAMARAIRAEIIKGWDFPLSTTPESQAEAGAAAALDALLALLPTPEMVEAGAFAARPPYDCSRDASELWRHTNEEHREMHRRFLAAALTTLSDKDDRT